MGKLTIGVLAFVAGGVVGAIIVGKYFKDHALGLTAQGLADKLFGEGSEAGKIARGLGDTVQGLQ